MPVLNQSEFKAVWNWTPISYKIIIGEQVAHLYNQDKKLLISHDYLCNFDKLDMRDFIVSCIYKLTKLNIEKIQKLVNDKFKIKEELYTIYAVPVPEEYYKKRFFRTIQLRKKVNFKLTLQPNHFPPGYFYAEIETPRFTNNIKLMNDNPIELLVDLFFTIESFIEREETPITLSYAWYEDFIQYASRNYFATVTRYNVEQAHKEYMYLKITKLFNETTKVSHKEIIDVLRELHGENKYYIMETILSDKHFKIDENDFLIYKPTLLSKVWGDKI